MLHSNDLMLCFCDYWRAHKIKHFVCERFLYILKLCVLNKNVIRLVHFQTKTVLNLWFRVFWPMIGSKSLSQARLYLFMDAPVIISLVTRKDLYDHKVWFSDFIRTCSIWLEFFWAEVWSSLSETLIQQFFWNRSILQKLRPPNLEILDTFGWQVKIFRLNLRLTFD